MVPRTVVGRQRIFFLPKEGSLGQDRFSHSPGRGVWVLCDGASEGFDGGGWAKDLSRSAARFGSLHRAVEQARISRFLRFRGILKESISDWSQILARQKGSYSTLLRVRIGPRSVQVEAVGDTILFFLQGYEVVYGFPSMEAEFFLQDPPLISDRLNGEIPPILIGHFPWRKPRITSLLLSTDALALFLLSLEKEEQRKILSLLHRGKETQIRTTLEEERERKRLRWDDLSYLWLDLRRFQGHLNRNLYPRLR